MLKNLYLRWTLGGSYSVIENSWITTVDRELNQLDYELACSRAVKESGIKLPHEMYGFLHSYLSEHLPETCENARPYCPEKVGELEKKMEIVRKEVYPLPIP